MVTLVKTLMTLRGLNQTDLAKHSGISDTAISRFFNQESNMRSEAMFKILSSLGADVSAIMKREIDKSLGREVEFSIGEDIRILINHIPPIARKTITDTLIASLKNDKNLDIKHRIDRLKKYRDSIKTVRRLSC